ncbi:hypothetical protein SH580_19700 [Coraliomargarita algicola]|uniref:Uncharacterized protein n=1 Tax=Coraliomargarita algicola TaxID=3092156 RepID=A0ABZ0RKG8_9BACT|nr:hypothetical protein [Coraliomargarita sp. J2-16]WPJ95646.1 hypothetical protein SH580_19700 [Coraliomargarita sp. J2-16]
MFNYQKTRTSNKMSDTTEKSNGAPAKTAAELAMNRNWPDVELSDENRDYYYRKIRRDIPLGSNLSPEFSALDVAEAEFEEHRQRIEEKRREVAEKQLAIRRIEIQISDKKLQLEGVQDLEEGLQSALSQEKQWIDSHLQAKRGYGDGNRVNQFVGCCMRRDTIISVLKLEVPARIKEVEGELAVLESNLLQMTGKFDDSSGKVAD